MDEPSPNSSSSPQDSISLNTKLKSKKTATILLLIFLYPIGVIFMWYGMKKWKTLHKILISLPAIALTGMLIFLFASPKERPEEIARGERKNEYVDSDEKFEKLCRDTIHSDQKLLYCLEYKKRQPEKIFQLVKNALDLPEISGTPISDLQESGKVVYQKSNNDNTYSILSYDLSSGEKNVLFHNLEEYNQYFLSSQVSRDGTMIAYSDKKGIHILDKSGTEILLIPHDYQDPSNPQLGKHYIPYSWSPDNSKLIINARVWETGLFGVYDLKENTYKDVMLEDQPIDTCSEIKWAQNSKNLIIAGTIPGTPLCIPGVYTANTSGNPEIQISPIFGTRTDNEGEQNISTLSVSNNNALFVANPFPPSEDDDNPYTIYNIDLNNNATTVLRENPNILNDNMSYPSSDPNTIFSNNKIFLQIEGGGINTLDLISNEKKSLFKQENELINYEIGPLSPNERYLLFTTSWGYFDLSQEMSQLLDLEYAEKAENVLRMLDLQTGEVYFVDNSITNQSQIFWIEQ